MSAYLIDQDYCVALGTWAAKCRGNDRPTVELVETIAKQIYEVNVESLQARYPGEGEHNLRHPDLIWYEEYEIEVTDQRILSALNLNPGVIWFAAVCAEYQSCEFTDWEQRPGGKAIRDAQHHAGYTMAKAHARGRGWPDLDLTTHGDLVRII